MMYLSSGISPDIEENEMSGLNQFESLLRQLRMKLIRQEASVVDTKAQIASIEKVVEPAKK